jgi:hypothetical protein
MCKEFSVSCVVQDKKACFSWKLVVLYGFPYEDRKVAYIDELHSIMSCW